MGLSIRCTDNSTGAIVSWLWDFGDGTTSTARAPEHTYEEPGTYEVTLTVTDCYGREVVASEEVEVASTLTGITISGAPSWLLVGQTAQLTATAHYSDAPDADVTNEVTWTIEDTDPSATVSSSGLLTAVSRNSNIQVDAFLDGHSAATDAIVIKQYEMATFTPTGTAPSARSDVRLATDGSKMLMWGGQNASFVPNAETWQLDAAWAQKSPTGAPSARVGSGFIYDSGRGTFFMFGGTGASWAGNDNTYDLAANASAWTLLTAADGVKPTAPRYAPMTWYDPAAGKVFLLDGYDGSTYYHDFWSATVSGTTVTWTSLTRPSLPGDGGVGAYDAARGVFVRVASSGGNTWTFDGVTWMDTGVASPPNASIAWYDPEHEVVVAWRGSALGSPSDALWIWDGAAWVLSPLTSAVTFRAYAGPGVWMGGYGYMACGYTTAPVNTVLRLRAT